MKRKTIVLFIAFLTSLILVSCGGSSDSTTTTGDADKTIAGNDNDKDSDTPTTGDSDTPAGDKDPSPDEDEAANIIKPNEGDTCTKEYDKTFACTASSNKILLACTSGTWKKAMDCPADNVCVSHPIAGVNSGAKCELDVESLKYGNLLVNFDTPSILESLPTSGIDPKNVPAGIFINENFNGIFLGNYGSTELWPKTSGIAAAVFNKKSEQNPSDSVGIMAYSSDADGQNGVQDPYLVINIDPSEATDPASPAGLMSGEISAYIINASANPVCVHALGFGTLDLNVKTNLGIGGSFSLVGNLPLFHPTKTPLGDLTSAESGFNPPIAACSKN